MVALKGVDFRLPILESSSLLFSENGGYLLGGMCGTQFLVTARGLDQPRAGRGVVCPGVVINTLGPALPTKTIR